MFRKMTVIILLTSLLVQSLFLPQPVVAQLLPDDLPVPGALVASSVVHRPLLIKGLKIDPTDPMRFDFLIASGDSGLKANEEFLRKDTQRLIKYFLACLTIPEGDLWVNLSPYEKDRMIPDKLGQTELGRDLLAQDYILKQLTASLLDPNKALGKDFWERVHTKARELYGTSEVPLNVFNKVWILADTAKIFQRGNSAYLVSSHLKVMLDEDYVAKNKEHSSAQTSVRGNPSVTTDIIREIILPEIEREVNEGKNFATIRQIFHSFILASWYKKTLKGSLLNEIYADKSKVKGVDVDDPKVKEKIYERYIEAYKKGVINLIKEEFEQAADQTIARRYFSGGTELKDNAVVVHDAAALSRQDLEVLGNADLMVTADIKDAAMSIGDDSLALQDQINFGDLTQEQVRFLQERVNTLLEANNVFGGDEYDPVRVRLYHNQRGDPYFTQGTGFFYLDIPVNPSGTIRDLLQAIEALLDDVLKVKVTRFSGWNALRNEALRIVYKGPQKHTDRASSNRVYRSRRDRDDNEKAALTRLEMEVTSAQTSQEMDELIEEINESDIFGRKNRQYLLGLADRYYPQAESPDSAMITSANVSLSDPSRGTIREFLNQTWIDSVLEADLNIKFPSKGKDLKIVLIGPGKDAGDLRHLLARYPEAKQIDVVDVVDLQGVVDDIKKALPSDGPVINFYQKNIIDMQGVIQDADIVMAFFVLDERFFSPEGLTKAGNVIEGMLKSSGVYADVFVDYDGRKDDSYRAEWLNRKRFKHYKIKQHEEASVGFNIAVKLDKESSSEIPVKEVLFDEAMTAREGEGVEFASIDHPQTWQETKQALAPRIEQYKALNEHSASGVLLFLKDGGIVWNWKEQSAPHITMAIQAGLMGDEDKRYIGTRVYVVDKEVELTIPALDSLDDFIKAADILGLNRDLMPRVKEDIKQNRYFMDYLRRQIYLTAKLLMATEPMFGQYKLSTGSESLFDSYQGSLGDFLKAYAHLDDGVVVPDAAMSAGLFTSVELKNQAGVMPRILADFSWAIVDYMMKEPLWWPLFNGEPVAVKDINSAHLHLPIGFGVIERVGDTYVLSQATKKVLKAIQFVHSDQVFQFLNANRLPASYPGQDTQMMIKVFSQNTPLYISSSLLQGYIYYCRMDSKEDFILLKPFLNEDGIAVLRLDNDGKDWQMTEVANGKAVSLDYDGGRIDISYVNGTGAVSIKGEGHLAVMAQARTDSAMKSFSIEEYADMKDPQTWEEARAALGNQVRKLNGGQSDSIGVIAFGQGKTGTAVVWKMGARYNSHHHHLARDIFGYTEPLMHNKYPGLQIRINKEERSVELTPALGDLKRYVQEAKFLGLNPDDVPRRGSDIVQNTAFLKFLERQVYLTAKLLAQADEEVAQYSIKIGSRRIFTDRKQGSVEDFVTRYASLEDEDKAMFAQDTLKGGIDLKASDLKVDISSEGSEMALRVDAQLIKQLSSDDFKGLVPVVIRIMPIEGAWHILGIPEDKRLKVAAV